MILINLININESKSLLIFMRVAQGPQLRPPSLARRGFQRTYSL